MKTYKEDVLDLVHQHIGRVLSRAYPDLKKRWKLDFQLRHGHAPRTRQERWFEDEWKKTASEHIEVSLRCRDKANEKRKTRPRPYCPACDIYFEDFGEVCSCGAPLIDRTKPEYTHTTQMRLINEG